MLYFFMINKKKVHWQKVQIPITDVNVKYADADVDDLPTPEQQAANIGYSGSFTMQDFAFVGSTHLYNSDATPKSQYLVTSSSG